MAAHDDSWQRGNTALIDERWSKGLSLAAVPVIVLIFYVTASMHFNYTPGEALNYVRCAKSIMEGGGISLDLSGVPTGVQSPLWFLTILVGMKLGVDPLVAAKGIDLVFASCSVIVFHLLAREIIRDEVTSLCATLVWSVNAWLLNWAGTGLDVSIGLLLLFAAMRFLLRNEYVLATLTAGLLTLVRLQACALMALILVDVIVNSHDRRRALTMSAVLVFLYGITVIPISWLAGGLLGAGSFVARGMSEDVNHGGVFSSFLSMFVMLVSSEGAAITMLLCAGLLLGVRLQRHNMRNNGFEDERYYIFRQSVVGIGWLILFPLLDVFTNPYGLSRDVVLISPVIIVYAIFYLHRFLVALVSNKSVYVLVVACTAVMLIQSQLFYRMKCLPEIEAFELLHSVDEHPIH